MQRRPFLFGRLYFFVGLLGLTLARPALADDLIKAGGWALITPAPENAKFETVAAEGQPGGNKTALRLTIVKPSEPFYGIALTQPLAPALPEGTRLRLRFWGRSATNNPVRVVIEKEGPPYTTAIDTTPTLTPVWRAFDLTGATGGYGPNGLNLRFQAGHQAGVVELAGVRVDLAGPDPALAATKAALKPDAIQARIEKYRKGRLTIQVRDKNGRPVLGARLAVVQTRHAFLFGCDIFLLQPDKTDALQRAYQTRFTDLFNYATLPFYWGAFESEKGKPDYARLEAMARWCRTHGVTPKGHPLIWHEVYPSWAPKEAEAAIPLLRARVFDLVPRYRGLISIWDALNEANNAANTAATTGEGAWIKRDGPANVVATALGWARAAGKETDDTFLYNDFNIGQDNVSLLAELQKRDALPDAVGIQSHMHSGKWSPEKLWQVATQFGQFGRPVHFTETTVLSGPPRNVNASGPYPTDWNTTPEGEADQANYLEKFYTVLFSHPALRAITYWDLSDESAWQNAPAGLIRKDMSPKPAYERLLKLIHTTWRTNAQGTTDRAGQYRTRAFYGDYQITATDKRGHKVVKKVALPYDHPARTVMLTLE